MFDFLDEDWFIITLEVIFLILIIYDIKQYIRTKKKEYITNTVLTLGFAIWTLYPMYISYFGWDDMQKTELLKGCSDDANKTECNCVVDAIFKEYTYKEYTKVDQEELKKFKKESYEECSDDGWF
jgi:predicted GIY-YIG superfamily endonuclease